MEQFVTKFHGGSHLVRKGAPPKEMQDPPKHVTKAYAPIHFVAKNVTGSLPRNGGEILFNPAVVHWKNDLYLCSYRVFVRYADLDTRRYDKTPYFNPNHPWLGNKPSQTFWASPKEGGGYDVTRLVLARIMDREEPEILTVFSDQPRVDARLFKLREDRFAMTGNSSHWIYDQNLGLKNGNCRSRNGCMLMFSRVLTLRDNRLRDDAEIVDGSVDLFIGDSLVMCPQFSGRMEKNWSMWRANGDAGYGEPNGELLVSTWISPRHEVFHLDVSGDKIECPTIEHVTRGENILGRIAKYYNKVLHVSLSTPALAARLDDGTVDDSRRIAFGHVKYVYKHIKDVPRGSPLTSFHKLLVEKKKHFHPTYVYLMYIYEFEATPPYRVTRVSDFFLPETSWSLVFANSLTWSPEQRSYVMAYGDHDNQCWLLYMTPTEVENALRTIRDPRSAHFLLL